MARFAVDGDRITFDDGGMNLLSAEALRELRASVEDRQSCLSPAGQAGLPVLQLRELRASVEDRQSCLSAAGQAGLPVLHFKSGRPGLFAAGADMAEMQRFTPAQAEEFSRLGQTLFDTIERLPCLTVAEIDGDCLGGALDLALAFDFRFATPRSRFSHPGARIGMVTGFGGTSRWRKVTGRSAANTLLLKNAVLSAGEALKIGLVDEVGDDHTASIERLKAVDPLTVRFVKELTIHQARLSRSQLLLLAERLGHLYFGR